MIIVSSTTCGQKIFSYIPLFFVLIKMISEIGLLKPGRKREHSDKTLKLSSCQHSYPNGMNRGKNPKVSRTPHTERSTQRMPNSLKGPVVVDVDPTSTNGTHAPFEISPSNVSTTQTPCPTPHKPARPVIRTKDPAEAGGEGAAAVLDHDLLQQPIQTNLRKTKRRLRQSSHQ